MRKLRNAFPTIITCLLAVFPAGMTAILIVSAETLASRILVLAITPLVFSFFFVLVASVLSIPFQSSIISGKFRRVSSDAIYSARRCYGTSWCAFFYCTPIYYTVLNLHFVRKWVFYLYGYRGDTSINLAPDAWVRDLPLLKLGPQTYIANKATIGTNMCLAGGTILVDSVVTGNNVMVGHLALIAPGCKLERDSEIGVGSAVGIRVHLGERVKIGPTSMVNHGALLESGTSVGPMSYIGLKVTIGPDLILPSGSNIPDGAELRTQADVAAQFSSETMSLIEERNRLENTFISRQLTKDTSDAKVFTLLSAAEKNDKNLR